MHRLRKAYAHQALTFPASSASVTMVLFFVLSTLTTPFWFSTGYSTAAARRCRDCCCCCFEPPLCCAAWAFAPRAPPAVAAAAQEIEAGAWGDGQDDRG